MLFVVVKDSLELLPDNWLQSKKLITYETGKSGDNPHYHIIIDIDLTADTARAQLKKSGYYRPHVGRVKSLKKSLVYITKELTIVENTLDIDLSPYLEKTIELNEKKKIKGPYWRTLVDKYTPIVDEYNLNDATDDVIAFVLSNIDTLVDEFIVTRYVYTILLRHYPHIKSHFGDKIKRKIIF